MTQFTRRKFSVPAPGTDEYRDNYEKTFGKKPEVKTHNPAVALEQLKHHQFVPKAAPYLLYCGVCGNAVDHELHHQVQKEQAEAIELTEHTLMLLMDVAEHVLRPTMGAEPFVEFREFQRTLGKAQADLIDLRDRVSK